MADQSEVETALAALAAEALYPHGPEAESRPGPPCRIYRGWPNPTALDADLAMGRINVTIFAGDTSPRLTTRFTEEWLSTPALPTLLVSTSARSITFSGNADPGQVAGILIDRQPYLYRTRAGDSPALVAATLTAQIRTTQIVHLRGASLEIPDAQALKARVAIDRPSFQEIRRQLATIRITCWCPSPETRDSTATIIDTAFAAMPFIQLPDTSQARLTFAGGAVLDQSANASLYRRDLLYAVEYATTQTQLQPSMLFGTLGLNAIHITA